jgi:tetratricopeptide (TPR) repeat protein
MTQNFLKILAVLMLSTFLLMSNEQKSIALNENRETLETLWEKAKNNDLQSINQLTDYYLEKGAFNQALSQLERLASPETFCPLLLEKVIRAVKGMGKERETIARLKSLKTKHLLNESILLELYLLTNNKPKAQELIQSLSTLNSSPEFIEFLANGAIDCLPPGEALPFFERFIESELKKDEPNYHPFIKAAKLQVAVNKPLKAMATLEAYLDSFSILKDFKYPFTDKLFTEGYSFICEEFQKIKTSLSSAEKPNSQTLTPNSQTLTPNSAAVKPQSNSSDKLNTPTAENHSENSKSDLLNSDFTDKTNQPRKSSLDSLIRQVLTTPPDSDNKALTQKIKRMLDKETYLEALEHLSLAILFKKCEFNELYFSETKNSLSRKLTDDEIKHLSTSLYPDLEPIQVISTHQSSVYYELARYQNINGNLLEAVSFCKDALIENPGNEKATVLIEEWGKSPSLNTMVNKALREVNEIHNNVRLLSILAESEYNKSNFPKMYDAAHRVFGYAPHNTHALKAYVFACLHKKQGKMAVEACLKAIGHGADSSAWPILAEVAINTGMTVETRLAVKDLIFSQSPLNVDCLTGYLSMCDNDDSRNEFTTQCKENIKLADNTENIIILRTMAAASSFLNQEITQATTLLKPVFKVISPSNRAFTKVLELSYLLNMDQSFAECLKTQAESIIDNGSLPYYWEAARLATRANLEKTALVYYGKAIEQSDVIAALEDEFLSFGRTARGFPFFIQGFLEKTTGHYDFYGILGKYYLMKGHKTNSVAFLKLAADHLPHRSDIQFLLGRALCANNQSDEGFQLADKALDGIEANTTIAWGMIREALNNGNSRLLKRIIKRWTMSPDSELRRSARKLADYGHLKFEYLSMLESEEGTSPYALWLPLIRADYAMTEARKTQNFEKTFSIFENALKRTGYSQSAYEKNSISLSLAKAYFQAIVESKDYERGISTFSSFLSKENKNMEIRKLYEQLCVLTYKEGELLKSIDESMYSSKPLSRERMKRSWEIVNELFKAQILNIFLDQLPPLSTLSSEEAASQIHLRWCGSLLTGNPTETTVLADNLGERLKALGADGLPVLEELGRSKDALLLIESLLLRHGQINRPNLLLEKARLLSLSSKTVDEGIRVYEEIIDTIGDSNWAKTARIELLKTLTSHNMFSPKHMYVVDQIQSQRNRSLNEMVAIGKSFILSNSWTNLIRLLEEIYSMENLYLKKEQRKIIAEFLEVTSSKPIPEDTNLKRNIALIARKLLNPITDPVETDRLKAIYIKMEDDYLRKVYAFSKKETSKSRGIEMFLKLRDEGSNSIQPIPDEEKIALCEQLIRLRPPVKDVYGNSLVQRGRIALANLYLERGQKDEATKVAKDIIADSHDLGPDEPGSCWLEAKRIMLNIMYSQKELKLVRTDGYLEDSTYGL